MRSFETELGGLLEEGVSLLGCEHCAGGDAEYFALRTRSFDALFRKECLLAQEADDEGSLQEARELEALVDRYAPYRRLLKNRLVASGAWKSDKDGRAARLHAGSTPERLILLITRRCQLRCSYCDIQEYGGDISEEDVVKAVDFLFTSTRRSLTLQFFGGEPLLRFDLIQKAVARALGQWAAQRPCLVTTNGLLLQPENRILSTA